LLAKRKYWKKKIKNKQHTTEINQGSNKFKSNKMREKQTSQGKNYILV